MSVIDARTRPADVVRDAALYRPGVELVQWYGRQRWKKGQLPSLFITFSAYTETIDSIAESAPGLTVVVLKNLRQTSLNTINNMLRYCRMLA